jgi:hypothetical protein
VVLQLTADLNCPDLLICMTTIFCSKMAIFLTFWEDSFFDTSKVYFYVQIRRNKYYNYIFFLIFCCCRFDSCMNHVVLMESHHPHLKCKKEISVAGEMLLWLLIAEKPYPLLTWCKRRRRFSVCRETLHNKLCNKIPTKRGGMRGAP